MSAAELNEWANNPLRFAASTSVGHGSLAKLASAASMIEARGLSWAKARRGTLPLPTLNALLAEARAVNARHGAQALEDGLGEPDPATGLPKRYIVLRNWGHAAEKADSPLREELETWLVKHHGRADNPALGTTLAFLGGLDILSRLFERGKSMTSLDPTL